MNTCINTPFRLLHEIFVLDAYISRPLAEETRHDDARGFVQQILDVLKMEPLGSMQFHDAVDDRAPGWSFVQAITTSHVSGHYFEKPGRMPHIRIDFYSCQSVDWKTVVQVAHRYFGLDTWRATFINRQIDSGRSILDIQGSRDVVLYEHEVLPDTQSAQANKSIPCMVTTA